ncbi:MAG: urea transport system ATP-binding protein [Chloroflexota bacterium]|jgi:urea transport system ATP-binding protein|nr:urea transport system ATP-binding protein [Chloroflexota bacterium]
MLSVERLEVSHGRTRVLFGVSLEVSPGGLMCVIGRNGVGKSTLLNAVMGVLRPSAGRVVWEGRDLTRMHPYERVHAGLAYVPQGHATFPQLTVRENLMVVLDANRRGDRAAVDEVLDLFPRLRPLLARRAGFLSGGQQQQLAIARALVTRPRLLLMDEPTEGIQPSIILEIEDAIAQLHAAAGLSILMVEQYVEFALRLADSYVVLDAGAVVTAGETAALDEAEVRRLLAVVSLAGAAVPAPQTEPVSAGG